MENLVVRKLIRFGDDEEVAKIGSENFSGLREHGLAWIRRKASAWPVYQYFVALLDRQLVGYVLWTEHGGFRKEAFYELEQIAVAKNHQGKGIGSELITRSLQMVRGYLRERESWLKTIGVTTSKENEKAQRLYGKTLSAKIVATIPNLYQFGVDEVIMIARYEMPQ